MADEGSRTYPSDNSSEVQCSQPTSEEKVHEKEKDPSACDTSSTNSEVGKEPLEVSASNDSTASSARSVLNSSHLKKTCEACVKSKVRCEGGNPCERCLKRGIDCQFMLEQKRGRRPGPLLSVNTMRKRQHVQEKTVRQAPPQQERRNSVEPSFDRPNNSFVNAGQMPNYMGRNMISPPSVPQLSYPLLPPQMNAMLQYQQQMWLTNQLGLLPAMNPMWHLPQQQPLPQYYPAPAPVAFPSTSERRLLRTIFALFRSHHKSHETVDKVRHAWFETRFNLLCTVLRGYVSGDDYAAMLDWMRKNNFNYNATTSQVDNIVKITPRLANLAPGENALPHQPELCLGTINVFSDSRIECDEALLHSLGYVSEDFTPRLGWPVGGMLFLGGDAVAKLAARDEDVLNYSRCVAAGAIARFVPNQSALSAIRVTCDKVIPMVHKRSGMQVNCIIVADILGSCNSDGILAQCVSIRLYLAQPMDQNTLSSGAESDLAPWPSHSMQSHAWLRDILEWA